MTRAAIYVRISEDKSGEAAGVSRQLDECRDLAARRGITVVEEFIDNDFSATNGKRRPEHARLFEAVRAGRIDGVVVWDPDRLYRLSRELRASLDLLDATDLTIYSVQAGTIDLNTPAGRAIARTLVAWAGYEVEHKVARQRSANAQRAREGVLHPGGVRPFGFAEDHVTTRPDEAALVRDACARVLAGETVHAIATEWNARGIRTPRGGEWRSNVLRGVLRSPRIAGLRVYRTEVIGQACWSPIITVEEHTRVVAATTGGRTGTPAPARRWLLSGILRCGRCGAGLLGRVRHDTGVGAYYCAPAPQGSGCGRITIKAVPVEELIVDAVLDALANHPGATEAYHAEANDAASDVMRAIGDVEARKAALTDTFARGLISHHVFTAGLEVIDEELTGLRVAAGTDRVAILDGLVGLDHASIDTRWAAMSLDRRRAVIRATLGGDVRIMPSTLPKGSRAFEYARVVLPTNDEGTAP